MANIMDIIIEQIPKAELFRRLIQQHEIEIQANKEWCEQTIIWQNGCIVRYEKKEKYQ